jgi:hypothetical protein
MAYSIGVTNPFLRPPGPGAGEVNARGLAHGQKIRGENLSALYWAYGRKTWGKAGNLTFPNSKTNVDKGGQISLYSPRTHLPYLPFLTGVDTSNEGPLGAIIKATVNFTIYPSITQGGVSIEKLMPGFFKPGSTIGVQFGWTTWAAVKCASRFGFSGKVLSFSWSVNTDVSINASTSMMSQGVIALGVTGNLSKPNAGGPQAAPTTAATGTTTSTTTGTTQTWAPLDAKTIQAWGLDLGTEIDRAMAKLNPLPAGVGTAGAAGATTSTSTSPPTTTNGSGPPEAIYGIKAFEVKEKQPMGDLLFAAVGIPWQPDPPSNQEVTKQDEALVAGLMGGTAGTAGASGTSGAVRSGTSGAAGPPLENAIVKKFWYVNFGSMEKFLGPLITAATKGVVRGCDIGNKTTQPVSPWTSAYPMEVIWDGADYTVKQVSGLGGGGGNAGSPIAKIWFNCDFVKEQWRKFFNENNKGDASEKSLKQFLSALANRANEASGDYWQLSCTVIEKISTCGGLGSKLSVLAVEDFSYCEMVGSFGFNASFGRPMLKNVSISMQGSSQMGAASLAGGNVDTPAESGVTYSNPGNSISELKAAVEKSGINTAWGDAMKGALKAYKKSLASHHSKRVVLFPIDFNVTIDGCSGWGFCESINSNLKPPGYGGSVFSISGINNKIDVNNWETSIKGIMRMP